MELGHGAATHQGRGATADIEGFEVEGRAPTLLIGDEAKLPIDALEPIRDGWSARRLDRKIAVAAATEATRDVNVECSRLHRTFYPLAVRQLLSRRERS